MTVLRVVVHGRVQGVGFRYSARAEAERLGVHGWVRNRDDGSVEAEISGSEKQLERMLRWLEHGPRGASVRSLDTTPIADESVAASHGSTFRITY